MKTQKIEFNHTMMYGKNVDVKSIPQLNGISIPKVSFAHYIKDLNSSKTVSRAADGNEYKPAELEIVSLYDVLNEYYNLNWSTEENKQRKKEAKSGYIVPYLSTYKMSVSKHTTFESDGVVFIDIDNINTSVRAYGIDDDRTTAQYIFDNYDMFYPYFINLIGCTFSASGNLHFFSYDPDIKGEMDRDDFKTVSAIHLIKLAAAIKEGLNIDLRQCDVINKRCLDPHNNVITQIFYNASSEYWISPRILIADKEYNLNYGNKSKSLYKKVRTYCPSLFEKEIKMEEYEALPDELKNESTSLFTYKPSDVNIPSYIERLHNTERMYLFSSLLYIYNRNDAQKIYDVIIDHMEDGKTSKPDCKKETKSWEMKGFHKSLLRKCGINVSEIVNKDAIVKHIDLNRDMYIPKQTDDVIVMGDTQYLYDYKDYLKQQISINKQLYIKGSVGIGKTYAFTKICKEDKGLMLVPYRVLLDVYSDNDGLIKIDDNDYKPIENNGCVMTYDRITMMESKYYESLRNKTIYIDESHILVFDVDYRNKLSQIPNILITLINDYHCNVVFISATPIELRGTEDWKMIEFTKPRLYVDTTIVKCKNVKLYMYNYLRNGRWRDKYNRVVVFSDNNCRLLYDSKENIEGDTYSIIHSDYDGVSNSDTKRIRETELLDTDITLCTRKAYNGMNFKNKDERVLIVSDVTFDTTSWAIIQQCGRLRNSVVDLLMCYSDTKPKDMMSVKDKREFTLAHRSINCSIANINEELVEDDIYYNAMLDRECYINYNNGISRIKEDLKREGYFRIINEFDSEMKGYTNNPLKKQADDLYRNDKNMDINDPIFSQSNKLYEYYIEIKNKDDDMLRCWNVDCSSLNSIDWKRLDTMEDNLRNIFSIHSKSEIEWNDMLDAFNIQLQRIKPMKGKSSNECDDIIWKRLYKELKDCKAIRETYNECIGFDDCMNKFIEIEINKHNESNEKKSIKKVGNQNASKSGYVIIKKTNERIKFDSVNDLMNKLGKGKDSVSNLLKKGETKYYTAILN